MVITLIKNLTGSWLPVYHVAAVGLAIKAVLYWRFVSIKPARVLFAEQNTERTTRKMTKPAPRKLEMAPHMIAVWCLSPASANCGRSP